MGWTTQRAAAGSERRQGAACWQGSGALLHRTLECAGAWMGAAKQRSGTGKAGKRWAAQRWAAPPLHHDANYPRSHLEFVQPPTSRHAALGTWEPDSAAAASRRNCGLIQQRDQGMNKQQRSTWALSSCCTWGRHVPSLLPAPAAPSAVACILPRQSASQLSQAQAPPQAPPTSGPPAVGCLQPSSLPSSAHRQLQTR